MQIGNSKIIKRRGSQRNFINFIGEKNPNGKGQGHQTGPGKRVDIKTDGAVLPAVDHKQEDRQYQDNGKYNKGQHLDRGTILDNEVGNLAGIWQIYVIGIGVHTGLSQIGHRIFVRDLFSLLLGIFKKRLFQVFR